MSKNRFAIFSFAVGVLVALALIILYLAMRPREQQASASNKAFEATSEGQKQPLPAYRLATLKDQKELSPDELRRGRVLLVFLTTGCGPCIKELDTVTHLYRDAPPDLRIYGVGIERPAQIETFVKEFDLKFPILIDMSAQLAKSLDIHYFPSTYLIEDGVIIYIWRGATQDEAELRRRLNIKGAD
jgi:peroxiredoxin